MFIQMKFPKPRTADSQQDLAEKASNARILRSCLVLGVTPALFVSLAACDAFSTNTKSQDEIRLEPRVLRSSDADKLQQPGSASLGDGIVEVAAAYGPEDQQGRIAVTGSNAIPYPIYPDAKQYRIGGENGLHVVLFETSDTFEEVDSFYKRYSGSQGFSRLVGMADYVRYDTTREAASTNTDAWKNDKPGIVIHGFTDSNEAANSGANPGAKTNIIVSY